MINLFIEATTYKCILLQIGDVFTNSSILVEKNFDTEIEAFAFKSAYENDDTICVCMTITDNFIVN